MNIALDRRAKTPLHQQIEMALRSAIFNNEIVKDEPMPSIDVLAKRLEVDASTIRLAYEELQKDNTLRYNQGIWSVNHAQLPSYFLDRYNSLANTLTQMGLVPSVKTLALAIVKTPKPLSEFFEGPTVLMTRRLYLGNQKPIAVIDSYFDPEAYPDLPQELLKDVPYYDILKAKYGVVFDRIDRSYEGINLDDVIAAHLDLPKRSVGVKSRFVSHTPDQRLIEVVEAYSRPELMSFALKYNV